MDWIDDEYRCRNEGHARAMTQDQHAAVNARYPGCTLEYCCECGEATGNAGPGDGSLYDDDGNGPFCDACFDAANAKLARATRPLQGGKNGSAKR